jgi:hypothetical protein
LRNKTEKDVRYRYCKGCGWKKAIKEQVTVEKEMAEIDAQIHSYLAEFIAAPEMPKSIADSVEWMKDVNKKIDVAVGIPTEIMRDRAQKEPIGSDSDGTQESVPTTEQEIPKTVEDAKYCPRCKAYHASQEPCIPERAGSVGTRQTEPKADTDKPTIEHVIAKVTGEPEKKPKKGFLKRLFGK